LAAQARVRKQVARVLGSAAGVEVARSRSRGKTLHTRPDRNGDHVLLEPFLIANARVAPDGKHIDEPILYHDLHADVGIGLQERCDDGRQYDARGARRHVEF